MSETEAIQPGDMVALDPWRVDDVQEPRAAGSERNLPFVLDALAAQYAIDICAFHFEGVGTYDIDDSAADDLLGR